MTRFSLDSNVLVYAADLAAGERHERALLVLDRAVRRSCVLTLQALAEFFHVTTRKRMVARTEAAAQVRDWATEFPTISADSGALWTALEFTVDGRFGWWDALLLATAERHGCEVVLAKICRMARASAALQYSIRSWAMSCRSGSPDCSDD